MSYSSRSLAPIIFSSSSESDKKWRSGTPAFLLSTLQSILPLLCLKMIPSCPQKHYIQFFAMFSLHDKNWSILKQQGNIQIFVDPTIQIPKILVYSTVVFAFHVLTKNLVCLLSLLSKGKFWTVPAFFIGNREIVNNWLCLKMIFFSGDKLPF